MSGSIPASAIVNVIPSVISAGGSGLNLSGLMLSNNALAPTTATFYASAAAVQAVFGPTAVETTLAGIYFAGFEGATQQPAALWIMGVGTGSYVPATIMSDVVNITTNWATFFHAYQETGPNMLAFAAWCSAQNGEYAYFPVDFDTSAITGTLASTALMDGVKASNYQGIAAIWGNSANVTEALEIGAFASGAVASINFNATNGRSTLAFKSAAGLTAQVTSQQSAANLIANGYNFYGAYATASQQFTFFNPGQISGPSAWIDSYINHIWLDSAFQLAIMELLTTVTSIPYNQAGYAMIEAALLDPITTAGNFGAFRSGVTLSSAQIAEVNNAAGKKIDTQLSTVGYYLQVVPATAAIRAARTSPVINFWYLDGGSVQQITIASIEVQ